MESSSETTTEQSKVSSNKLVTCVRNKRRKSEEQDSLDLLPKSEESKDDSTVCSSRAYEDSSDAIKLESCNILDIYDKDVRAKDGSTLIEYECKRTDNDDTLVAIDKSDLSFQKSKFVICDKVEEPCSATYTTKSSSNSGSGGWSSKSICSSRNTDYTLSDTWSMEPNLSCRNKDSEIRRWSLKTRENIPTDRSSIWCNCKNRRSFTKTVEKKSWMICNCITEEEEDVCDDVNTCQKFEKSPVEEKEIATVCFKTSEDLKETAKFVPCPRESAEKLKEDAEILEKEKVEEEKLATVTEKEKVEEEKLPTVTEKEEIGEEKLPTVTEKKEIEEEKLPTVTEKEEVEEEKVPTVTEKDEEPKEIVHDVPKFVPPTRTIKPEAVILKQLLKRPLRPKPKLPQIIDQKDIPPPSVKKEAELLEPSTEDTVPLKPEVSPRILAKYKLPKKLQLPSKFVPKEPTIEEKRTPKKVKIVEEKLVEKDLKEKVLEKKENDISRDTKTLAERTLKEKDNEKIEGTKMTIEEEEEKDSGKDTKVQKTLRPPFLFKGLKQITDKTERPKSIPEGFEERKKGIVEPPPSDNNPDKSVDISETKTNKFPEKLTDETKEIREMKEKRVPSKLYDYIPKKISISIPKKIHMPVLKKIPILGKKYKSEPSAINSTKSSVNDDSNKSNKNPTKSLVNEKNKKNNPTFNPSQPIKEDINKSTKDQTNHNSNKGNPETNKSLIVINSKNSSVSPTQTTDTELGDQESSKDDRKISEAQANIENREFDESLTKPQFEEKLEVQREEKLELQITKTQEEKPIKMMHVDVQSEKELLSTDKELAELESQTICTNYLDDYATTEKSTCNCYYLPIHRSNNESINYPKSCMKRERQCCHTISQESNNSTIPYHDKRSWEECNCRRTIPCRNCHRPRTECRYEYSFLTITPRIFMHL